MTGGGSVIEETLRAAAADWIQKRKSHAPPQSMQPAHNMQSTPPMMYGNFHTPPPHPGYNMSPHHSLPPPPPNMNVPPHFGNYDNYGNYQNTAYGYPSFPPPGPTMPHLPMSMPPPSASFYQQHPPENFSLPPPPAPPLPEQDSPKKKSKKKNKAKMQSVSDIPPPPPPSDPTKIPIPSAKAPDASSIPPPPIPLPAPTSVDGVKAVEPPTSVESPKPVEPVQPGLLPKTKPNVEFVVGVKKRTSRFDQKERTPVGVSPPSKGLLISPKKPVVAYATQSLDAKPSKISFSIKVSFYGTDILLQTCE